MRRYSPLLALPIALAVLAASPTRAGTIEGVAFAPALESLGAKFVLHGLGVLRWRLVFKPYVAAFYRAADAAPDTPLAPGSPRRLEPEYFYDIDAAGFRKATWELLERNAGASTVARMRPQVEALNRLYRDVKPGDRYALTFVPGRGTELALSGNSLGVVEGDEFGEVVHAMWLGRDPVDTTLQDILLEGE